MRSGVEPAESDQVRGWMIADPVEQLPSDRAIQHAPRMRRVTKQEWQIEHVQIVDHVPQGPDADTRDGQRAELCLLDFLLLATELHRRVEPHREATARGVGEFLTHVFKRDDTGVAQGMRIGGLQTVETGCAACAATNGAGGVRPATPNRTARRLEIMMGYDETGG